MRLRRSHLYSLGRLWGDTNAIRDGRVVRRIASRIWGRLFSGAVWDLFRQLFRGFR